MSRVEGMTLREVTCQLRERLREPARQATLLGRAYTLLDGLDTPQADRDLSDATDAIVKSLQEHGRSHELAAYNGCAALTRLTGYRLADGSSPFATASVEVTLAAMRAFPRSAGLQAAACCVISNLCSALSTAEFVAAGGIVDAVFAALHSAGRNVERGTAGNWQYARRNASAALTHCCSGNPAAAARAHELGAASAVLAALRAHPADAAVHCRTLSIMARDDQPVSLALLSERAVEAIAESMRARPLDAALQCAGLAALGDLIRAEWGDGRRRAFDAGVAELALSALREERHVIFSHDAEFMRITRDMVCASALWVIRNLPATGAAVARAVTEAMFAHPEHELTQRNACSILDGIADLQQEREAAIAAGAAVAIVRALRRFPELGVAHDWARGAGWHALAEMSTAPWCLLPAVTAGGVEAACDGLQRHLEGGEEDIIVDVLKSLVGMLHACAMSGDKAAARAAKRRAVATGCAELLVSAARRHPGNGELAYHAAAALGFLNEGEPTYAERAAEAGGVERVCSAFRSFRDNPDRVRLCARAILHISSSSLAGAVRAREAGALELLAEAIRSFPEHEDVQRDCAEARRSVSRNEGASMMRRLAGNLLGFMFGGPAEGDHAVPTAASAGPAPPAGSAASAETASVPPAAADAPQPATTSSGAAARQRAGIVEQRACHSCGAQVGGFDPHGQAVLKLSACGGCRAVRYCSVACSREAWPSHKAACKEKQAEAAARGERAANNDRDGRK